MNSPNLPLRILISFVVVSLVYAFIPLLIANRWDWQQGWVFALVMFSNSILSRLLVARRHPDLLAERGKAMQHADAKEWDKKLAPLVAFLGPFTILITCGLDKRFGWSAELPLWVQWVALVVLILGCILGGWALIENRFFSGLVRIQSERDHHVIDSGPYRLMRHPGYAGALLAFLAAPFQLNTLWGMLPGLLTLAAFVVRTALEDKTLQAELPGYADYTRRTRYRLFPGIW